VVLELVGGKIYKESVEMLAQPGQIVIIGVSSIDFSKINPFTWLQAVKTIPRFNFQGLMQKSYGVSSVHLGFMLPKKERLLKIWTEATKFMRKHKLKPLIGKVFSFEDLPKAQLYMESRKSHGKVIIKL
ncbi:MAG: zinc-binding dehydrogenase, partial [Leptospirales bacterium]